MAYSVDLPAAARRNLDAAESLLTSKREPSAAYLFGIAAECAVKQMAREIPGGRDDVVFKAHFPALRGFLLDRLQGRSAQTLRRLIERDGFMNQWDIKMRYAPTAELRDKPVNDWAVQARDAVNTMGT